MRIVGLIPARGGSKRLPGKNMKPLGGRPLIDWTISAAKLSGVLDDIYVSTDDDAIAEYAESKGCKVVRDSGVGVDMQTDVIDPFAEAVEWDGCVLLQPTSPLRPPGNITMASIALRRSRGLVSHSLDNPRMWRDTVQGWAPVFATEIVEDGAVYAFMRGRPLRGVGYEVTGSIPWQSVDIDTDDDFAIAELMLERHREEIDW